MRLKWVFCFPGSGTPTEKVKHSWWNQVITVNQPTRPVSTAPDGGNLKFRPLIFQNQERRETKRLSDREGRGKWRRGRGVGDTQVKHMRVTIQPPERWPEQTHPNVYFHASGRDCVSFCKRALQHSAGGEMTNLRNDASGLNPFQFHD